MGSRTLLGGLVVLAFLATVPAARAQKAEPEKVKITTVDGVDLQGHFYAGRRDAPVVMMLHAIGEHSRNPGWVHLAEELQKKGLAVLTFDFRGHGSSTTIDPLEFGKYKQNKAVKVASNATFIEHKDFAKSYYTVLCNDIAAARSFLDRKHDKGICNTRSLIVIGADSGATLGAIWLNAEWCRFRYRPPGVGVLPKIDSKSEGEDIIAAVWLSISPTLGARSISLAKLLEMPARGKAVPMIFMHSDGDSKGKNTAKSLQDYLVPKTKDKRYNYTAAVQIKGSKLTGSDLLQKSLGTAGEIAKYLDGVIEEKKREWIEREFVKTHYVWRIGVAQPITVKPPDDLNLYFDTYEVFLRN